MFLGFKKKKLDQGVSKNINYMDKGLNVEFHLQ